MSAEAITDRANVAAEHEQIGESPGICMGM